VNASPDGGDVQDSSATSDAHSSTSPSATGYVNPVCGAVIDPARAVSSLTVRGQTHYFCCEGCRVEFERDPEKYLALAAHMRAPEEGISAEREPQTYGPPGSRK
jgi:xanthine dehydrogenase accessory factor